MLVYKTSFRLVLKCEFLNFCYRIVHLGVNGMIGLVVRLLVVAEQDCVLETAILSQLVELYVRDHLLRKNFATGR